MLTYTIFHYAYQQAFTAISENGLLLCVAILKGHNLTFNHGAQGAALK